MVCRFPQFSLPKAFGAFGFSFLWPVCAALAAAVYVDCTGNDANSGTADRPLRSLAPLGRRNWAPGDAVYFRGGQSFTGILRLPGGGTDSRPVIVGSYGIGRATIDSVGDTLVSGYNQGGFQFQDLNLRSSSSGGTESAILFYSDSPVGTRYPAVTVKNCELRGFGGPAIKIGSWQPSNPGWTRICVENCRLIGNGEGMAVFGYDASVPERYASGFLHIGNSEFEGNRGTGLSICGVSGGLVELCSFHDNQGVGGCWTWAAKNVLIQRCISYRNRRGEGNDGFGFDLDGGSIGCTIEYCLSYENDTAGFAIFDYPDSAETVNNTIRFCISENDVRSDREGGSFAMNAWANTPIRNSQIHHCVAFLSSRGGRSVAAGFLGIGRQAPRGYQSGNITGCGFRDNLVYLEGEGGDLAHLYLQIGASLPSEIVFKGNTLTSSSKERPLVIRADRKFYASIADWREKTGQEISELAGAGVSAVPKGAQLGQYHQIIHPAMMGLSTLWQSMPSGSCLGDGRGLGENRLLRPAPGLSRPFSP